MYRLVFIITFFLCSCETKCGLTNEENSNREVVTFLTNGKALFLKNCAACHHPLKADTGPPFRDILERHNIEWIYKYVTDKKMREERDCLDHKYDPDNKLECIEFNYLKREEIEAIFNFTHVCNIPRK